MYDSVYCIVFILYKHMSIPYSMIYKQVDIMPVRGIIISRITIYPKL